MTFCDIGNERMESCGNRLAKFIICAGPYKVEEYRYKVVGCKKSNRKICIHIKVISANCRGNHPTSSLHYTLRHKADIMAHKKRS